MKKLFKSARRHFFLFFLTGFLFSAPLFAAEALSPLGFGQLSDRDLSPEGRAALSKNKEDWKHAESRHFIFHFKDEKLVATVYEGAETYYNWIKNLFKISEDPWKKKVHIFVFEDEDQWKEFASKYSPFGTAHGFTNGWELYMVRGKHWMTPRKIIAHELTHVILFRFLDGRIPLFLNEGFSEYVSFRVLGLYTGGNQYALRSFDKIKPENYIDFGRLSQLKQYPESVDDFYIQSEAWVRYLVDLQGGDVFYHFLKQISDGESLEKAINQFYHFSSLDQMEESFRKKVIS